MTVQAVDNKFGFALGLAAILAYISVRNTDPVRVVALGDAWPSLHVSSPFFRHRGALPRLRDFLLTLRPKGQTVLGPALSMALRAHRTPAVAIVLSDFLMEPAVYEAGLEDLVARRFTVAAVRVIGTGERDPTTSFRRGRLIDTETGRQRYITLGRDNLARYQAALEDHLARLHGFCSRCEIAFCAADTAAGLDQSLFHDLPAAGLVH